MSKIFISFSFIFILSAVNAQTYTPTPENLAARKDFQDMKFGMFIHWGASSVLGHGEWVMNERNIKVSDYKRLINIFNPQNFDAKKWVAVAKSAGMKYITFITRHHDGFSNWNTKQSDWKITATPYAKDALKQLADECHKEGIKLFCYYSLLDWYRSDYQYETGKTGKGTGRTEKSDWENYIRFMKAQLTELLTEYGKIDGVAATGDFPADQIVILKKMGKWLKKNGESIYGTRGGPVPNGDWGGMTFKDNKIYVHILNWPKDGSQLVLSAIDKKIIRSKGLNVKNPVVKQTKEGVEIDIPVKYRNEIDSIIELEIE